MSFKSFFKGVVMESQNLIDRGERFISSNITSESIEKLTQAKNVLLLSRSSGMFLRIVRTEKAGLALELTADEKDAVTWQVFSHGKNVFSFHNNGNYLCMRDGNVNLHNSPPEVSVPERCLFMARSQAGKFVSFENMAELKSYLGVLPGGKFKNGAAGHKDDVDCHFTVIPF